MLRRVVVPVIALGALVIFTAAALQPASPSPQQARPPDGSFMEGIRVALVRDAGSYFLVTSESGITAYVSTGSLRLID